MAQQFFSYVGPATNGQKISWLTYEEAMELQKQEDQMVKEQQQDAALAPAVNKAVSSYAAEKGISREELSGQAPKPIQYAKGGEIMANGQVAKPGYQLPRDPLSQRFDDLQAKSEDTSELESVLSAVPPQRGSPGAAQSVTVTPGTAVPTWSPLGMAQDNEPSTPQSGGVLSKLLSDLPDEIAQPLLIRYHAGEKGFGPSKFLAEVRKAKEEMLAIKRQETVTKASTDADLAKQAKVSEGQLANTKLAGDKSIEERRIAEENANYRARLAAQTAGDKGGNDPYAERTLRQYARGLLNDFEDNNWIKTLPKVDLNYNSISNYAKQYEDAKGKEKQTVRQYLDQELFVAFNKMLDPNSAVLPGEFERTALGQGLTRGIINAAKSGVQGGLKIDDFQRKQMVNAIKTFRNTAIEKAKPTYEQYKTIAERTNVDPYLVVGAYSSYFGDSLKAKPEALVAATEGNQGQSSPAPVVNPDKRKLALQALEDPEATPEEKAKAREWLLR